MTGAHAPIWQRVADAITADIRDGRLTPGDRIPTAAALAAQHQVSRSTALRAISTLQTQGILTGEPGRAVIVTGSPAAGAPSPEALAARLEEMEERVGALEAGLEYVRSMVDGGEGHGRRHQPGRATGT